MTAVVEPGQVWRHRHECRLCSGARGRGTVHHRVLVLEVVDEEGVLVVDVDPDGARRGEPYRLDRARFGSFGAGGLGLVAAMREGSSRPVPVETPDVEQRRVRRVAVRGGREFRSAGSGRRAA